jgi:hypothetical protein
VHAENALATLPDLVIASRLEFEHHSAHSLNGAPGEWRISAVTST